MVSTVFPALSSQSTGVRLALRSLQPQLSTWRRQIHQWPELGFEETQTSQFICQKLQKWGIEHRAGVAKTGVVAVIPGHRPGPVLGIRADMDALPIQELNTVEYRSQRQGIMHACGHDGHTAIALGTAYYLSQHRDSFAGTVKIIFQPAEEGPGGAKPMIEAGALADPQVDAMIGLHLWNNLPLGTVGVRTGPMMAATELFHCSIQGKGGHGAIPDQTVDSIVVAAQVINALQTIVARNISPLDAAVVTVGKLTAGTALNVIADSAHMSGTVRYFDARYSTLLPQRIEQVIAGVCQSHGAGYSLDYQPLYPAVVNDPDITDMVRSVALSVIETPVGVTPDCQTMGGEDMAFFLQEVPGCYFFLGSANRDRGLAYPHHHPRFDFDETALATGVEMFIRCVETFCRQRRF
ncbi:MAG: M20 family metallopeptidase [Leptolyngbya sp.]|nr:M20 family metallopeptidase [Leptolyngbya sp.]